MMNPVLLYLQSITLQLAEDFLDGTRTSVSGDFVSSIGENVLTIVGWLIFGVIVFGLFLLWKTSSAKYSYPPGRKVGRISFTNLNGVEFFANVSINEEFVKHDLRELYEMGVVKTEPEVVERLERDNNYKVYNAKIIKYGQGVKWRSKNRMIQIHTRLSLEDPNNFSNAQRSIRGIGSIFEPEVTKRVFIHSVSTIEKIKDYSGKMKQVHSMAVIPTNPQVKYSQYSNIFKDKHITIPMNIDALDPGVSEKFGNLIEWTPLVASLEKENKQKEVTLKHFDKVIDEKSIKNSKFNMVINKMRGALEQKRLTGSDVKREPMRIASQVMISLVSVIIGGMAYTAWESVTELRTYSPWFGVIISAVIIAVIIHASEKKKKDDIERLDAEVD